MDDVTQHLNERQVRYTLLRHRPVNRASDRAKELGVPLIVVMKAVLVKGVPPGFALAILPACSQISMDLLKRASGGAGVGLAKESDIKSEYDWCALGALPSLPDLLKIPAYVDSVTLEQFKGVMAAGEETESVVFRVAEFIRSQSGVTEAALSWCKHDHTCHGSSARSRGSWWRA